MLNFGGQTLNLELLQNTSEYEGGLVERSTPTRIFTPAVWTNGTTGRRELQQLFFYLFVFISHHFNHILVKFIQFGLKIKLII